MIFVLETSQELTDVPETARADRHIVAVRCRIWMRMEMEDSLLRRVLLGALACGTRSAAATGESPDWLPDAKKWW